MQTASFKDNDILSQQFSGAAELLSVITELFAHRKVSDISAQPRTTTNTN